MFSQVSVLILADVMHNQLTPLVSFVLLNVSYSHLLIKYFVLGHKGKLGIPGAREVVKDCEGRFNMQRALKYLKGMY